MPLETSYFVMQVDKAIEEVSKNVRIQLKDKQLEDMTFLFGEGCFYKLTNWVWLVTHIQWPSGACAPITFSLLIKPVTYFLCSCYTHNLEVVADWTCTIDLSSTQGIYRLHNKRPCSSETNLCI